MATFEKRKKFKHFLFSPLGVLVLGVIVIFLGFSVFSVFQKREEARTNANTAQYEVLTLRESELKTQAEIDRLNTDAGVEEAIRNKYRAAKPGEGLVVITDDSRTASVAPATPVAQKKSWWQTFTSMFKKQ
jgi:cell division protein FtsB